MAKIFFFVFLPIILGTIALGGLGFIATVAVLVVTMIAFSNDAYRIVLFVGFMLNLIWGIGIVIKFL